MPCSVPFVWMRALAATTASGSACPAQVVTVEEMKALAPIASRCRSYAREVKSMDPWFCERTWTQKALYDGWFCVKVAAVPATTKLRCMQCGPPASHRRLSMGVLQRLPWSFHSICR